AHLEIEKQETAEGSSIAIVNPAFTPTFVQHDGFRDFKVLLLKDINDEWNTNTKAHLATWMTELEFRELRSELMMQDWKMEEQKLYTPAPEAHAVHIPKQFYFVIDGRGSIGSEDFHERLRLLTALSEAVRAMPGHGYCPPGFADYSMYPPETLHH